MSGPIAPDTIAVVNSIKGLLVPLLLKDGITSAYQTVKIGGVKDYTIFPLPCAVILARDDDSVRHEHGGTIKEPQEFEIRTVCDNTDAEAAELQVFAIRDALMPILQKYAVLPNTVTVYHSQIKPHSAHFSWMWLKPNWYRIHRVTLLVAQYYVIPGGIQ